MFSPEFFNLVLIDPSRIDPDWLRWLYLGFNSFEAAVWFGASVLLWFRFKINSPMILQSLAFLLFGLSDVLECHSTTPLLLLFKVALIIALMQGRKQLLRKS